jgi:hypothetical protein
MFILIAVARVIDVATQNRTNTIIIVWNHCSKYDLDSAVIGISLSIEAVGKHSYPTLGLALVLGDMLALGLMLARAPPSGINRNNSAVMRRSGG